MTAQQLDQLTEQYALMAHRLAHLIEWDQQDHDDLVHEGLIGAYEAFRGYLDAGREIVNPAGLAWVAMRRAMRGFYRYHQRRFRHVPLCEPSLTTRPLDAPHLETGRNAEQVHFEQRVVEAFLDEAERIWGIRARLAIEQLMQPTEPVARLALREAKGKEGRKRAGEAVRGVETVRVTQRHIREALGIKRWEWAEIMRDVRAYAEQALLHDTGT